MSSTYRNIVAKEWEILSQVFRFARVRRAFSPNTGCVRRSRAGIGTSPSLDRRRATSVDMRQRVNDALLLALVWLLAPCAVSGRAFGGSGDRERGTSESGAYLQNGQALTEVSIDFRHGRPQALSQCSRRILSIRRSGSAAPQSN